jgi:hypothetical protein
LSASSHSHHDEEDYAGELWEELDTVFQAQEAAFVNEGHNEDNVLLDMPGNLLDTLSILLGMHGPGTHVIDVTVQASWLISLKVLLTGH